MPNPRIPLQILSAVFITGTHLSGAIWDFVCHLVNAFLLTLAVTVSLLLYYSGTTLPPSSFPTRPRSSVLIDPHYEGLQTAENHACCCPVITINMLPDEVLLAIFDFCVKLTSKCRFSVTKREIEAWQSLVHVCRLWRSIVFGSPRRLILRLFCTTRTPARDMLDIWPALPFVIWDHHCLEQNFDNTIALLEHSDRVRYISLRGMYNSVEKLLATMQGPLLELTYLDVKTCNNSMPVLPDSFLAGPAPRLRTLRLYHLLFPSLPKLLLSATHLVYFLLLIPHFGQFSPKTLFTALAMMTTLESLDLEIQYSLRSHTDQASRHRPIPPPQTRSVLPVLTFLRIKGESKYLEDLVARIDAPQLSRLYLTVFNQIAYDVPQLAQFICRTPRLKAFEKADVAFELGEAGINLTSQTSGYQQLGVGISCMYLDRTLSSLMLFTSSLASSLISISTLEDLCIYEVLYSRPILPSNIENALWLELLRPFTAVKDLYLSEKCAERIVPALQGLVGRRTTEVLPTLRNLFLEGLQLSGLVYEGIEQFAAARQVASHPISVTRW